MTLFTVCPKCAGELVNISATRASLYVCDGRCGKVWKVKELEKLLGDDEK